MWHKAAITDGELDALRRAALAACAEDTVYPRWRGSHHHGGGHCLNIAHWLVRRLGGSVGACQGHYAWLSPGERHYIDLTGDHEGYHWLYQPNDRFHRVATPATDRATRFADRADRIFEGLPTLIRLGLDLAGDAYPAQEAQAADDSDRFDDSWIDPAQYWHDEGDPHTPEGVYQFVYANGDLEVSPNHSHAELSQHVGVDPAQHTGPFACGHLVVANGRATWEVQANVNLHSLFRVLKDATKNYGWTWGGMTDANGQPIIEDFAPKSSARQLHFVFGGGHLFLGRTSVADLGLRAGELLTGPVVRGDITITGDCATVRPVHVAALDSLFEWAADSGLTLYAGNDNVIKTIPDLQQHDVYSPDPAAPDNPVEQSPIDERLPSGLYSCPSCQRLFPNWHEYSAHRRQNDCVDTDHPDANGDGGLPEPDPGVYGDGAHFTEMRQEPGITTGSVQDEVPLLSDEQMQRLVAEENVPRSFPAYREEEKVWSPAYRRQRTPLQGRPPWEDSEPARPETVYNDVGAVSRPEMPYDRLTRPQETLRVPPRRPVEPVGAPYPREEMWTPQEIATAFGVNPSAVSNWFSRHGDFPKPVYVQGEGARPARFWHRPAVEEWYRGRRAASMRQEPGITTGSVRQLDPRDPYPQCNHCGATSWTHASHQAGREGIDDYYCDHRDKPLYGWREPETELAPHPDPLMDNEPGSLTLPEHWGKVAVLPARTWKEAARVDGFTKYATAFKYDNDDYRFYVAYRNGDPLGYAVVQDDGGIQMIHAAVEGQGMFRALFRTLTKHFPALYTNAAHEKTAQILKHYGWLQTSPVRWRWSKDQAPTDMLEASVPFIFDVQEDKIFVGHPGARTSDIPGRFTPGGIVEGTYDPGGKIVIRSLTSIPYTVRHMVELWYYTHPKLEVKSVHLQDDAGKDTRLAAQPHWDLAVAMRTHVAMDPAVHLASRALIRAGGDVYAVGGAVRDLLMGREPSDIDLMVTGIPGPAVKQLLAALPGKVVEEGKHFPVYHYRHKGREVHIALPRTETSTGPGHGDFDVTSSHRLTPEQDLYRRDFTANAMAINLRYDTADLLDPFGGASDIASGTLRMLGAHSLREDPLRVLRGLAAVSRFGLEPDAETREAMTHSAAALEHIPSERIRDELDKLLAGERPAHAIRMAHETGVLAHILPEVDRAFGYDQRNRHHELELGEHLLSVLARVAEKTTDVDLRLAALLHDIGKPLSAWDDAEGHRHFYAKHEPDGTILGADHADLGAELAQARLRALKYPSARVARIATLIAHHMWPAFTTSRGARRFLARVDPHAEDLFTLRWADQGGKTVYPSDPSLDLTTQVRLVARVRNAGEATTTSQLAISGKDLIKAGMAPGPALGKLLSHLTELVLDDPSLNQAETLLRLAADSGKIHAEHS